MTGCLRRQMRTSGALLKSQSLPPTCTAFCSFCAVTEQGIMFLQQQERSSGSRKLKLPGFFPELSGLALLLPLRSALSSFLQAKCQFCVHCQEALKPRKKLAQMTLRVESVPKSRLPGNTTGSAKDSIDLLNKRGSTAMAIVSDMKKEICTEGDLEVLGSSISKCRTT